MTTTFIDKSSTSFFIAAKINEQEQHTDKNTPHIIAKREKQKDCRDTRRKERYANEPAYKEKMKQLAKTSRLKKRARAESDEEKMLKSLPGFEDKVDGSERDTISPREGGEVTDSLDGNKAKKTDTQRGAFQVKTEPLSKRGLELFFQPRRGLL